MADKKISELTNITGANLADGDELVVVDTSASETKAITFGEFKNALDTATGFVSITGDTMTGDLALSGADITFGDNDKAIFGAGSDLQIYHDGSNSYISDQGTGDLRILAGEFSVKSASGNTDMIYAVNGGAVTLYNNGNTKLATTSTGVDITGTLTSDGLTVESTGEAAALFKGYTSVTGVDGVNNGEILLGNNASFQGRISYEGQTNGVLYIENSYNNDAADILFRSKSSGTAQNKLLIDGNGDISFYEDTGTTAKFFWDASAESLGIGTTSPVSITEIVGTNAGGALDVLNLRNAGADGSEVSLNFISSTDPNNTAARSTIKSIRSGANSELALATSNSEAMRIDSSGNVGIGTSSPDKNLHIEAEPPVFRMTNPQGTSSLGLSMGKIEWETRDSSASGVIGYIDVVDSNNFGTTFDMAFATGQSGSATERMRIDSSGNVGIGTSSPAKLLHLKSTAPIMYFEETDIPQAFSIGSGGGKFFIYDETDARQSLTIDSSGNVGIGTATPQSSAGETSLTINGSTTGRLDLRGGGVQAGTISSSGSDMTVQTGYGKPLIIASGTTAYTQFKTNGVERMRIDSSGRVGIGTSSPDDKLHVYSSSSLDHIKVDGPAAINRNVQFSTAGSTRWNIYANSTAETGSNAGSNLSIARYADDGSYIGGAVLIERSTGNVGIGTSSPSSHLHVKSTSDNIVATRVSTNSVDALFQSIESASLAQIGTTGAHAFTFFTSNQERMRIDSSGNVGIGLTSAGNKLEILGSVVSKALNTDTGFLVGENGSAALLRQYENRPMLFYTNNTERMRIDSSGNLLVGTTDTTLYNNSDGSEGVRIAEDHVSIASDARTVFYVNRQTSDGEIINIRKDGTTVGSIGTSGGVAQYSGASYASFGAGDVGFFANPASDALYPVVQTTLAGRDAAIDLGLTTNRFKDLYLSGGVYLGGTGSANKLDDYEEGSWTPVIKVGTTTNSGTLGNARYIKIGGMVTVYLEVYSITKSGTGNLEIEGLPYACGANSRYGAPFATRYAGIGGGFPVPLIQASTSVLQVQRFDTGSNGYAGAVTDSQLDSTYSLYSMGMTYFTS